MRSGHGVGKTCLSAWAVLWALWVRHATVPCTAPTQHQLEDVLWPEIQKWITRSPVLSATMDWTARRVRLVGTRAVAIARVANKPEGLAGFHADQLLYVIDEASGIPDVTMAVVDGALTTEGASALMVGNPTRPTGYFVDAWGRNSERWRLQTISSLDSDRVDAEWVQEMKDTWGEDSDVFRVRVLGLPPTGEALAFLPADQVRRAMGHTDVLRDGPLEIGVDVARYGGDKSAVAARRGWCCYEVLARRKLSVPQVAAWVAEYVRAHQHKNENVTVRVDDGGVGGGVTDLLIAMVMEGTLERVDVQGMNFGGRGNRWFHTNAGVWADTLRQLLAADLIALPDDDELYQQLTTRTFHTNIKGKIVLEPKDHLRSRGEPSPDKGDAVFLAFAQAQPGGGWEEAWGLKPCPHCGEQIIWEDGRVCPHCHRSVGPSAA